MRAPMFFENKSRKSKGRLSLFAAALHFNRNNHL